MRGSRRCGTASASRWGSRGSGLLRDTGRSPQSCALGHPGGADPLPFLLGQLGRPSLLRHPNQGHCRFLLQIKAHLSVRGCQPAPRARIRGVGDDNCPARSCSRHGVARHAVIEHPDLSHRINASASCWARKTSSPARIAASAAAPIRKSAGPSSKCWWRVRRWPAKP